MSGGIWLALVAALLQGPSPMRVVDKGDQSNIDEPGQVVARSAAEWEALWQRHSPDRPRPTVDLTRETIVGVFLGSRSTAGFGVEIVAAAIEQGVLVIRYRETRPAAGGIVAQVITSPYHIAALPRHSGEVRFEPAKSF
jgi:hypothetical protein